MTESSSLYQRAEASFAVMVIHAFVLHKLHRLGCFRCKILKQLIFSKVFGELPRMEARNRVDGREKPGHDVRPFAPEIAPDTNSAPKTLK
jgi:hypothetical protein